MKFLTLLFVSVAKPHPHDGKLQPYNAAEKLLQYLDTSALNTINKGKLHKTTITEGPHAKRVVAVQDVNAPAETVIGHILDYQNYANRVPLVLQSEIYQRISNVVAPNTETFFARLKTGKCGFSLEYYIKATHYPLHNSVVWHLDYDRDSDFDDACGYWHTSPHPQYPETKTRLYYSVDMIMGPNIPGFVASTINKMAATDAIGWVKKYSEKD